MQGRILSLVCAALLMSSCRSLFNRNESGAQLSATHGGKVTAMNTIEDRPGYKLEDANSQFYFDIRTLGDSTLRHWKKTDVVDAFQKKGAQAMTYRNAEGRLLGFILFESNASLGTIHILDATLDDVLPDELRKETVEAMSHDISRLSQKRSDGGFTYAEQGEPTLCFNINTVYEERVKLAQEIGLTKQAEGKGERFQPETSEVGPINKDIYILKHSKANLGTFAEEFLKTYEPPTSFLRSGEELMKVHDVETIKSGEKATPSFAAQVAADPDYLKARPGDIDQDMASEIVRSILKQKGPNSIVILGEAGAGKTFQVMLIMAALFRGELKDKQGRPYQIPEEILKEMRLLDVVYLFSGNSYVGMQEKAFEGITRKLLKRKGIYIADELHILLPKIESLKGPLANENMIVIGMTTLREYVKIIMDNPPLGQRFREYFLKALTDAELMDALLRDIDDPKYKFNIAGDKEFFVKFVITWAKYARSNMGRVRGPVDLLHAINSDPELIGKVISIQAADESIRKYCQAENIKTPDQMKDIMAAVRQLPQVLGDATNTPEFRRATEGIVGDPFAQSRANALAVFQGPNGSGREFASDQIAKVLGRKTPARAFDLYTSTGGDPQKLYDYMNEMNKDGQNAGPFGVIKFTNYSEANVAVKEAFRTMFETGEITTKDGTVINIPQMRFHIIANDGDPLPPGTIHVVEVPARTDARLTTQMQSSLDKVVDSRAYLAGKKLPPDVALRFIAVVKTELEKTRIRDGQGKETETTASTGWSDSMVEAKMASMLYGFLESTGYLDGKYCEAVLDATEDNSDHLRNMGETSKPVPSSEQ